MSKIFYDKLVVLKDLEKIVKKSAKTPEEKEELWLLIDEIIHHKVMGCILDRLPKDSHREFLEMFNDKPNDEAALFSYLKEKIGKNIEELIQQEIGALSADLLKDIKSF